MEKVAAGRWRPARDVAVRVAARASFVLAADEAPTPTTSHISHLTHTD